MFEKHFRYSGFYFQEMDPNTGLINTGSFLNKFIAKNYTYKRYKYFTIIRFQPIIQETDRWPYIIKELLFSEETYCVNSINEITQKFRSYYLFSEEADRKIKIDYASKIITKIDEKQIEFLFDNHRRYITTFNDGLLLHVGFKELNSNEITERSTYTFMSYNIIDTSNIKYDLTIVQ